MPLAQFCTGTIAKCAALKGPGCSKQPCLHLSNRLLFPPTCYNSTLLSLPPPDIDECAQGLHNCSQLCINSPGAHSCRCHPGFRPLDPAASRCLGEYLQCPPATAWCCPGSRGDRGAQLCSQPYCWGAEWTDCGCAGAGRVSISATQQPWHQAVAGITCLCAPRSPSPGAAPSCLLHPLPCPCHILPEPLAQL